MQAEDSIARGASGVAAEAGILDVPPSPPVFFVSVAFKRLKSLVRPFPPEEPMTRIRVDAGWLNGNRFRDEMPQRGGIMTGRSITDWLKEVKVNAIGYVGTSSLNM
jgi:hypothetical protein